MRNDSEPSYVWRIPAAKQPFAAFANFCFNPVVFRVVHQGALSFRTLHAVVIQKELPHTRFDDERLFGERCRRNEDKPQRQASQRNGDSQADKEQGRTSSQSYDCR